MEAQIASRSTAAASQSSDLLVVAKARQLAFVDLATAAAASAAQPASKGAHTLEVAYLVI